MGRRAWEPRRDLRQFKASFGATWKGQRKGNRFPVPPRTVWTEIEAMRREVNEELRKAQDQARKER